MPLVILKRIVPVSHLRNSSFLHIFEPQNPTNATTGADYSISAMVIQSKRLRNRMMMVTWRIGLGMARWWKGDDKE
jgi:hypothetical protein